MSEFLVCFGELRHMQMDRHTARCNKSNKSRFAIALPFAEVKIAQESTRKNRFRHQKVVKKLREENQSLNVSRARFFIIRHVEQAIEGEKLYDFAGNSRSRVASPRKFPRVFFA